MFVLGIIGAITVVCLLAKWAYTVVYEVADTAAMQRVDRAESRINDRFEYTRRDIISLRERFDALEKRLSNLAPITMCWDGKLLRNFNIKKGAKK
jgi:hypothetical protein